MRPIAWRRRVDRLCARGQSAGVKLRSRALALMPPDDARRPQLLADLGDALLWGGRFDEAERALAEAIELADRAGDEQTRVRSWLWQLRLRFQIDPDVDYADSRPRGWTWRRAARRTATTSVRRGRGAS